MLDLFNFFLQNVPGYSTMLSRDNAFAEEYIMGRVTGPTGTINTTAMNGQSQSQDPVVGANDETIAEDHV
jgi:hypothetical protein